MIVEAHDLWKRYGRFDALHGLEFGIAGGSAFALVGPNGAGKRHPRETSDWHRDIPMFAPVRPDSRIWCDTLTVPDEEDHSHLVLFLPL
jgi:hypothetical protein